MHRKAYHSTTSPVPRSGDLAKQVLAQEAGYTVRVEIKGVRLQGWYNHLRSQVSGFWKRAWGQTGASSRESD